MATKIKVPFIGVYQVKGGKNYRIVKLFTLADSSQMERTIVTGFFLGKDFEQYRGFIPTKWKPGTSYHLERLKFEKDSHTPKAE